MTESSVQTCAAGPCSEPAELSHIFATCLYVIIYYNYVICMSQLISGFSKPNLLVLFMHHLGPSTIFTSHVSDQIPKFPNIQFCSCPCYFSFFFFLHSIQCLICPS
jgi:hypothetical protein